VVQPNQTLAALVGCVLVAHRPQRQRGGYRLEGGLGAKPISLVSSDGMGFFEYLRRHHEALMAEKAAKVARMAHGSQTMGLRRSDRTSRREAFGHALANVRFLDFSQLRLVPLR
jgi:hypothetical protein